MSFDFGTLTPRLVHPTAPVLLTKNGPLGTPIQCPTSLKQDGLLTLAFHDNTAPVLLTKNGQLGTPIQCPTSLKQDGLLTLASSTTQRQYYYYYYIINIFGTKNSPLGTPIQCPTPPCQWTHAIRTQNPAEATLGRNLGFLDNIQLSRPLE